MLVKKWHRNGAMQAKTTLMIFAFAVVATIMGYLLYSGKPIPAGRPVGENKPGARDTSQVANPSAGDVTMVSVRVYNQAGELSEPVTVARVVKSEEEWRKQLTPAQYKVTRNSGTEPAFCGNLLDNKKEGVYTCVCCRLPLFASNAKFNSGTGWPSFFQPICKENVSEKSDNAYGMTRVEINCTRCDAHLGHVFEDGPQEKTGLRFCLNSESLQFTEQDAIKTLAEAVPAGK